jgi:hypothetical protein
LCGRIHARLEYQKKRRPRIGRSQGDFSIKIHVNVYGLGLDNPLRFLLTGGQCHDSIQSEALIAAIDSERLLADKSYDIDAFIQQLVALGVEVVIPPRATRREQGDYV